MTRRILRTSIQLGTVVSVICILLFFLDNRFGVLPDAIHNALPAHHPGLVITDITIATCSVLNPLSSCKLDQNKWHRNAKDLYLSKGWLSQAFIHIERKKEVELTEQDKIIKDVRISSLDPSITERDQGAEPWESRPAGIWLQRSPRHREADKAQAITAVDVLFGADSVEARLGWTRIPSALLLPDSGKENQDAYLSIRHGPPHERHEVKPHIDDNGRFKIMQIADLHLSTGPGACRDPEPPDTADKCEADPRTLKFISSVLDDEKPDLVVLSGDQVNGETAPDAQSALFKFAALLIERQIPYATIFGNHDDEGSLSREEQMTLTHGLPYSLSESGPSDLEGVGNYAVEVLGRGTTSHSALTLYLLDTHGYSPDERQYKGYDWIKKNQIDWFKAKARDLANSPSHKGYSHHHMSMAFIHIPLPEYRNINDMVIPQTGSQPESPTAPGFNSGFRDALVEEGVLAVSCGHDHANDYCSLSKSSPETGSKPELWMCYAGGSGFGGYGGYGGYHRRVRIFEFDMNEARISTWKRLEWGKTNERIDETIIVENNQAVTI